MSGWFSVKRGVLDHPLLAPQGKWSRAEVWIWMIENAAFKDTIINIGGRPHTVPRGSLCFSERFLSQKFLWSQKALRTFLDALESHGAITQCVAKTGQGTRSKRKQITLCNYEKYQTSGIKTESKRNQNGSKEEQGNKGTREAKASHTRDTRAKVPDGFDEFWNEVPRKVAKAAAVRAYRKAVKLASPETLVKAMRGYARSVQGKEAQFVVHPATWLNGERWNDQPADAANIHHLRPTTPQPGEIREIRGQRHVYRPFDGWVPEYA